MRDPEQGSVSPSGNDDRHRCWRLRKSSKCSPLRARAGAEPTTLKIGEFRAAASDSRRRKLRETERGSGSGSSPQGITRTAAGGWKADCLANRIAQPNNCCLAVTRDCIALQLHAASAPPFRPRIRRPQPVLRVFAFAYDNLLVDKATALREEASEHVTKSATTGGGSLHF